MCCVIDFSNQQSSVSVFIFVEANVLCISVAQDVYLSFIRKTLRKWVYMSHPRHFLCLASFPSPTSFLRKSGSSRLRGSVGCSDHNSVRMINISVIFYTLYPMFVIDCYGDGVVGEPTH